MQKKVETEEKKTDSKIYEVGYHIISSVAEENVPQETEKIKAIIQKEGGVVVSEDQAKLRPLAYVLKKAYAGSYKKFDKAYFGWVKFELTEGDVTKIDEALKAVESVLRYIIIKTVKENTIFYQKQAPAFVEKEGTKVKAEKADKDAKPASIEEIDKSIDDLIAE
jgi:ribosomal protein S6